MGNSASAPQRITTSQGLATRGHIIHMYVHLGAVAELANTSMAESTVAPLIASQVRHIIQRLLRISHLLSFNLNVIVANKLAINRQKYPVVLCRSSAERPGIDKYWNHCWYTGISTGTRCTVLDSSSRLLPWQTFDVYQREFLENSIALHATVFEFANERHWLAKYTANNTFMALSSEIGELAEHFHWLDLTNKTETNLHEETSIDGNAVACELADVMIYCVHFLRVVSHHM